MTRPTDTTRLPQAHQKSRSRRGVTSKAASIIEEAKEARYYGSMNWFRDMANAIVPDPIHSKLNIYDSPLVRDVYESKYNRGSDTYWSDTSRRVCEAVYEQDTGDNRHRVLAQAAMDRYLWMPGGRILAGAGTDRRVTLHNCYVNATLPDSMEGIADGIKNVMLTGQQGGGIGTDFSPLRPAGAILHRTGTYASGPLPFMEAVDACGETVKSAGERHVALMGTMSDTHPDLLKFVTAKHEKGKLTNFNVSVLVSDAFMGAVEEDEDWMLYFHVPPIQERDGRLLARDFWDEENNCHQYVYSVHRARDLWDQILRSTYEYAEPGVIFIDRVNSMNNLNYCETIRCTNPCGEQPLPPHGACDLGAVNLGRMVRHPFTDEATFDFDMLKAVASIGVRFLDNVIDVSLYPLEEQRQEQVNKRRIGIGVSGLADAMHQLGIRYGSAKSIALAEQIMKTLATTAYETSHELAIEKGAFPLYKPVEFMKEDGRFISAFSFEQRKEWAAAGLRNGVLLTIAPTGTTSIAYGNGSGGLEPVFLHEMQRMVTQPGGIMKPYVEKAYGARLWEIVHPGEPLPRYMNTVDDVTVHEHIRIQEVCQKWVDASISKTVNLDTSITFEEFRDVYSLAYDSGCKGCSTFRPSDVRGSILSAPDGVGDANGPTLAETVEAVVAGLKRERDETLTSKTVKVKWPGLSSALYLTVGYLDDGTPWEVFFNSKDQRFMEWSTALSLLMSLVLRFGFKMEDLATEFKQIHSLEGQWAEGQYQPSLIAYLGHKLEMLTPPKQEINIFIPGGEIVGGIEAFQFSDGSGHMVETLPSEPKIVRPEQCPSCFQYTYVMHSGCMTCTSCGHSKCG